MAAVGRARVPSQSVARLAQRIKAQGNGSLAAGAANAAGGNAPQPGNKSNFHPLQVLKGLETGGLLTGKQLNAAARALTVLETRPEIHGYKQISKQLGSEKAREAEGLSNLATRTEGNVSSVYKNIAESEAQNLARQQALGQSLSAQSAGIAQQGTQNLKGMQEGALGDYESQLQARGAPSGGGAQQALAQAVASQQAQQSADSQASRQFANQSGADFANYGRSLAGSTQMQGGAQVGAIGRDVANRIGESNAKYNTNIQTALGKLAEAKAGYGSKFTKNILGLREGEQKFKLGQEAVAGNKASLAATEAQNAASNAISQQNANSSATSAKASLINARVNQWEAENPEASSGAKAKQRKEVKGEVKEIHSMLPSLVAEAGRAPKSKKEFNQFVGYANTKASADPSLVRHVLEQWWLGNRTGDKQGGVHR